MGAMAKVNAAAASIMRVGNPPGVVVEETGGGVSGFES
jgi:hypothetical protein